MKTQQNRLTDSKKPALSFVSMQSQRLATCAGHGIALLLNYAATEEELVRVLLEIRYEQDIWITRHLGMETSHISEAICSAIQKAIVEHTRKLLSQ